MISIATTSGRMAIGTPGGTNSLKKCRPCSVMPTITTVKNTSRASETVMMMWLVTENEYGISASRFRISTNMKMQNTIGKNRIPVSPAAERTMPAMNS